MNNADNAVEDEPAGGSLAEPESPSEPVFAPEPEPLIQFSAPLSCKHCTEKDKVIQQKDVIINQQREIIQQFAQKTEWIKQLHGKPLTKFGKPMVQKLRALAQDLQDIDESSSKLDTCQ
jgi:hypothetical protein